MNRRQALGTLLVLSLLGGSAVAEEKLSLAAGSAMLTLQCGETSLVAGEAKVARECVARLVAKRVRTPLGVGELELLVVQLELCNSSAEPATLPLVLRLTPAASALNSLAFERHAFFVAGQPILVADTPARGAILAESAFAERPLVPQEVVHVASASGECRGEMIYDLQFAPGQTQTLSFLAPNPVAAVPPTEVSLDFLRSLRVEGLLARPAGR